MDLGDKGNKEEVGEDKDNPNPNKEEVNGCLLLNKNPGETEDLNRVLGEIKDLNKVAGDSNNKEELGVIGTNLNSLKIQEELGVTNKGVASKTKAKEELGVIKVGNKAGEVSKEEEVKERNLNNNNVTYSDQIVIIYHYLNFSFM